MIYEKENTYLYFSMLLELLGKFRISSVEVYIKRLKKIHNTLKLSTWNKNKAFSLMQQRNVLHCYIHAKITENFYTGSETEIHLKLIIYVLYIV